MSNLQIITDLCRMLDTAQEVIRQQAELLQLHGITTATGDLERRRQELLERIERAHNFSLLGALCTQKDTNHAGR